MLADLVPQLEDLVPDAPYASLEPRTAGIVARPDLHGQAVRMWAKDRREALTGLVGISVITCTIWAVTMWGGFPWPLFPMLAAAVNLHARSRCRSRTSSRSHERHLLKREKKAIEKRAQGRRRSSSAPTPRDSPMGVWRSVRRRRSLRSRSSSLVGCATNLVPRSRAPLLTSSLPSSGGAPS